MLRSLSNSQARWRLLAEVRKRRQLAAAMEQQQQQQQLQQQQAPPNHPQYGENLFYSDEYLFSPSPPPSRDILSPTPPAQQVLSLHLNPNQPISLSLSQSSFPPSPNHLASLLDHLPPLLALQTLLWSLRQPGFSVSPLLSRIAPLLPHPQPPSFDRFLSDVHALWMQPENPIPVPVIDPLLSLYCYAASSFDDILEVFKLLMDKQVDLGVHHYNQVMQAAVSKQHNDMEKAQWIFKHMVKSGPFPDATSYNILIYGHSEAGNSDEALRLFDEMMANKLQVNEATYSSVVSAVVKVGQLEKALWFMREMKYNGLRPPPGTYSLVLIGLCGKGHHENACTLLREMHAEGIGVDDQTHRSMLSSLCNVLGVQEAEAHQLLYGVTKQTHGYFG